MGHVSPNDGSYVKNGIFIFSRAIASMPIQFKAPLGSARAFLYHGFASHSDSDAEGKKGCQADTTKQFVSWFANPPNLRLEALSQESRATTLRVQRCGPRELSSA